jgi:hypothetical protein
MWTFPCKLRWYIYKKWKGEYLLWMNISFHCIQSSVIRLKFVSEQNMPFLNHFKRPLFRQQAIYLSNRSSPTPLQVRRERDALRAWDVSRMRPPLESFRKSLSRNGLRRLRNSKSKALCAASEVFSNQTSKGSGSTFLRPNLTASAGIRAFQGCRVGFSTWYIAFVPQVLWWFNKISITDFAATSTGIQEYVYYQYSGQ